MGKNITGGGCTVRTTILAIAMIPGVVLIVLAWRRGTWDWKALVLGGIGLDVVAFGVCRLANFEWLRGAEAGLLFNIVGLTIVAVALLATQSWNAWTLHKTFTPPNEIQANVAIALGAGAAIAVGILLLQVTIQIVSGQQALAAQREAVRLSVATQSDLSGLTTPRDPAGDALLDMTDY